MTKTEPADVAEDRFEALLRDSNKFCEAVGLKRDIVIEIFRTDSDWAFVLKIDALVETASKENSTQWPTASYS